MGQVALRTRELIRKICQANDVEILAGQNNELDKTWAFITECPCFI